MQAAKSVGAVSTSAPALFPALLRRWLGRGLETHISLPLFALPLLAAIWMVTSHFVRIEQAAAHNAARDSVRELIDTYEAQLARNLGGIDQTLKVLKYVVELKGAGAALPTLNEKGLLPSGLVFVVAIADRDGMVLASNPPAPPSKLSGDSFFKFHRNSDSDTVFVSETLRDAGKNEGHMHFTRRLNDADGRFAGIVIVEADPVYFTSGYERSRQGERGVLAMIGADGVMRAMRSGDKVSWGQTTRLAAVESTATPVASPWDGVARYISVRPLHGFPLSAMVALDRDEQVAPFDLRGRTYLWGAAIGSVLLVLIVTLVCLWSWQLTRTQRRSRRAQETFAAASEASLDAFFVMRSVRDHSGAIVDFSIEAINGRAELLTGRSRTSLIGSTVLALMPSYRQNGIFDDLVDAVRSGGMREAEWSGGTARTGNMWMHRQVVAVEDGLVAIVRDITERKLAEQRIYHMAHHDELTGLPNRSLIRDRLDQAILHAQRKSRCVAVAFIDLDSFKLVNDGLGHNAGDALLQVVGARMQSCLRADDTVGRFGGDEFVIILADLGDDALVIVQVLENIRQAVTRPMQLGGQEVQVSCSTGVAMYPRDGAEPNTLMMNADAAMYRAKETGNNRLLFYTREMNARVEEKLLLLEGLRNAIEQQQFSLLYQPKVDLRSGLIFGVEALIRWHHPEHGMISPLRFIGLAEESGLIVAIGDWVLRTACHQNMAWRVAGLAPISMSVNVSPRQFEELRLVERVALALEDSMLPADGLELEVTESLIMRDLAQSVGKMGELKAMGISLSIDDFGTGYSSLSALKSFPISSLKIDKSFVSELADNADDQAIAMAVISLGHKLNLRVIAEGVETEQQRDFLRRNDCDEMQGYLFSRPLPPDAVADMLRAQTLQSAEQLCDVAGA
ncbi:bifunctional diguanylate cyclase/phosphodiesterase [Massilia sp. TWR1-2-2]|uniref:bifunctional diguanylate cyclase/phosphodiesterase n=1 Tax=Massilia sp. TWR1-2-2 TaxID=2804584 RepID=UPI003CF88432